MSLPFTRRVLLVVAALLFGGCGSEPPVAPQPITPLESAHARFQLSGSSAVGTGIFRADGAKMNTLFMGSLRAPYVVASSVPSMLSQGIDRVEITLNPYVVQPGTYRPGDCPEPAGFGCFQVAVLLGVESSISSFSAEAAVWLVRDSSVIDIKEIAPGYMHAEFTGVGTYQRQRGGNAAQLRVELTQGSVLATR